MNDLIVQTDQRKAYVAALVIGCDYKEAGKRAGFSENYAYNLKFDDSIRAAVHEGVLDLLVSDAPASLKVLRDLRDDPKVSASVRAECAKTLLNRGGIVERKVKEIDDNPLKNLSEMTGDELRKEVAKISEEITNRANGAKLIEHEGQKVTPQVPDLFT